jgi:UDPglucose 6-dehydrogenase
MADVTIGFAGMTHLGLNSAVAGAERGFPMVCFDPDPARTEALRRGELPVSEPNLAELLAANAGRVAFTSDPREMSRCSVVYVAPDVPTDDRGESDLGPLRSLIETVHAALPPDVVLVVLSQVPPGFTRGLDLGGRPLYYQVETLIFGRAVERALHPERYIVGCSDPSAPLPAPYAAFLEAHGCPILPMRYESAELAKISINCCLVASVSVANTLAELCERIGADWSEIVPSLRLDRRIGQHSYIAPGLGIAGGNLERDLATVCRLADAHGTDAGVVRAWMDNSRHRKDWPLRALHREVLDANPDPVIAVLGLAYKEDTHSTKNSPAVALISALGPFRVRAYDPLVQADPAWHPRLVQAASALEACRGADAVCLMTPWREFRELDPAALASVMTGRVAIDPYGLLNAGAASGGGLRRIALGAPAEA